MSAGSEPWSDKQGNLRREPRTTIVVLSLIELAALGPSCLRDLQCDGRMLHLLRHGVHSLHRFLDRGRQHCIR